MQPSLCCPTPSNEFPGVWRAAIINESLNQEDSIRMAGDRAMNQCNQSSMEAPPVSDKNLNRRLVRYRRVAELVSGLHCLSDTTRRTILRCVATTKLRRSALAPRKSISCVRDDEDSSELPANQRLLIVRQTIESVDEALAAIVSLAALISDTNPVPDAKRSDIEVDRHAWL